MIAPAGAASGVLLQLDGIDKSFPGVHALNGVDLEVTAGVHALVGENGAGKSTLMGIASGRLAADSGDVVIGGVRLESADPEQARDLGLAIVYQEPALLPDLTVAENMGLGMPRATRPSARKQRRWAREELDGWRDVIDVDESAYVRTLQPDARFVVEICRALAERPKVLVLDEPTEHLDAAGVAELFRRVRDLAAGGCGVVYISHRIREVKAIADRITVLRDGTAVGTMPAAGVTEDEIIGLIVGRRLEARFPPKAEREGMRPVRLATTDFSGKGFAAVSMEVRAGEIVGLAGIDGHGQRETLRALAGLSASRGLVSINGRKANVRRPSAAARSGVAFVSNDRHTEGSFPGLSVRENLSVRRLPPVLLVPTVERQMAAQAIETYGIKAPSPETPIESLSGGNQQKAMMSRVLMTDAAVILADEPTQGVDVGARSEIYGILRQAVEKGSSAVIVSADASELAGLCDRVLIFSRGHVVRELDDAEVTERNITEAALTATTERRRERQGKGGWWRPLVTFAQGDTAPSVVLALVILALGIAAAQHNAFYLTTRNFALVLPLFAALAFIALGQQLVMLIGSIDLSVGPLAGFNTVVASHLLASSYGTEHHLLGWLAIIGSCLAIGGLNWFLIVLANIPPLIGTLVTFMGLQGLSLVLRPEPGGDISFGILDVISTKISFVPVAAIVAVVLAVLLEVGLYRTLFGIRLRGVGSRPAVARQIGVRTKAMSLYAYLGCSLFAFLGSLLLMAQVASGNAQAGISFTLSSIAAVVLGGASIFGGRGSFVGALLGAALLTQINVVTQFLGLDEVWQQYLLGGLTIAAAAFYSTMRTRGEHA